MITSSKTRVVDMTNRRQIHIRFTGQQTGSFPSLERDDLISDISDDNERSEAGDVEGLYVISVAARILEMHPQTLRKYERLGLVNPNRTNGMLRL